MITGVITEEGLWSIRKLRPALLNASASKTLAQMAQEMSGANTNAESHVSS
jgi:hypothetical protein